VNVARGERKRKRRSGEDERELLSLSRKDVWFESNS